MTMVLSPAELLVSFIRIVEVWAVVMDEGSAEALSTSHGEYVKLPSPPNKPEGSLLLPHQLSVAGTDGACVIVCKFPARQGRYYDKTGELDCRNRTEEACW